MRWTNATGCWKPRAANRVETTYIGCEEIEDSTRDGVKANKHWASLTVPGDDSNFRHFLGATTLCAETALENLENEP